ncbi:MAG: CopG family transcriptional regulator [bacterium]
MAIKNMSLAVDLDFQERLKKVAKQRNISVSKLIRDVVDKHLGPDGNDENLHDTVILKIPKQLKVSPEQLRSWLQVRFENIVNVLSKPESDEN